MEEITVSDTGSQYITYLYNALSGTLSRTGGKAFLTMEEGRTVLRIQALASAEVQKKLKEGLTEAIGIGYKYRFLDERLQVSLPKREKKLACAALIAADFEGDRAYLRQKIGKSDTYCIDGLYHFRLGALREKWQRIIDCVPLGFCDSDLRRFCAFLVEESKNKVYLRGKTVFGENYRPLRRSGLMGEEDVETEIMLSDAGFVYCLGEVEEGVSDFLQKFYAERAIFS